MKKVKIKTAGNLLGLLLSALFVLSLATAVPLLIMSLLAVFVAVIGYLIGGTE